MVKNVPAMQKTQVQSLGWEDPLGKGMATHSSILAWRIPWREEPGGLQSMGTTEQLTCSFTFKITSLKLEEIVLFFSCNFKQPNNYEVVSSLSSVLFKPLQLFDSTLVPI